MAEDWTFSIPENWLSNLPMVGENIEICLENGAKFQVGYGRVCCDGEKLHINIISKSRNKNEFPMIADTTREFNVNEIAKISLRDGDCKFVFCNPLLWLRGIPKSGKNRIFLLCANRDRMIEVEKGWLEYAGEKIFIREILRTLKDGYEIESHKRYISEVIAIITQTGEEPPKLHLRTAPK